MSIALVLAVALLISSVITYCVQRGPAELLALWAIAVILLTGVHVSF